MKKKKTNQRWKGMKRQWNRVEIVNQRPFFLPIAPFFFFFFFFLVGE